MAVVALSERDADITRLIVCPRRVAFLACDLRVLPGQRISGLRVIELRNVFPVLEVVALLAIRSEPAIVFILVTGQTGLRNAEEGAAAIADLDAESLGCRHFVGGVAAVAGQASVLA